MHIKVLGSASSQGIPHPLCSCSLCSQASGKNRRLRSSYLVKLKSGKNILLDSSPDWPQQYANTRLDFDYLFLSHKHRDHTQGLADLRIDLEAHNNKRLPHQKQRVFLLGKTLDGWLSNGKKDSRWQESTHQAYQQLISRKHFKRIVLTPYKKLNLEPKLDVIYIRGKHANIYCGGLVITEESKTLVYLADIIQFNSGLIDFLVNVNPDLTIVHVPFFFKPKEEVEKDKHPGVKEAKSLPGKKILLSHFSHRVKYKHQKLVLIAKKIDKRFIVAYDNREIEV